MNESLQTRNLDFLSDTWKMLLSDEFSKPYMEKIRLFLRNENRSGFQFFPPKDKIFRALKVVDYNNVKVVILGQDPYHGQGQANGLCFAVENGFPPPPSLMNIFKEIESDIGKVTDKKQTNLESWANQGVLLLNTVLTVRENAALSHRDKGWEIFTDKVISLLNEREKPIVFLLWGSSAQVKSKMITNPNHIVLRAPHPSPLSSYRGFFGCKHFSKTNKILADQQLSEIVW